MSNEYQGGAGLSQLPPGTFYRGGQLYRSYETVTEGGSKATATHPVALTQAEARAKRWDWYSPEAGWVLEGYKLQTDRKPEDILSDGRLTLTPAALQQ